MSQRVITTEWIWYLLALYAGLFSSPTRAVTVRTPPGNPATVEAQAKFFQDFFSVQLSPYKIEFGHVCEDPNTWEQRYEKNDYKNHRAMGKVRWGDKKGGYGEHYWDLNHAGHADNHGDDGYTGSDDGSSHESYDSYDEPSENTPSYGTEEYDPEKSSYEESGRAKRAHPKIKIERKTVETYEEDQPKLKRKHKEQLHTAATHQAETKKDRKRYQYQPEEEEPKEQKKSAATYQAEKEDRKRYQYQPEEEEPKEQKKQVVLVVTHKDDKEDQTSRLSDNQPKKYVPYEDGAGVRQHYHPEVTAAASIPRLFLEPSTGHVVDRNTGQAYVLQPIATNY